MSKVFTHDKVISTHLSKTLLKSSLNKNVSPDRYFLYGFLVYVMAKINMMLKINSFPTDYEHSMKLSFQNSSQQITVHSSYPYMYTENDDRCMYSGTWFVRTTIFSTESGHTRQVTLQRIDETNIESKELHKRWTL